jgi:short-subunit dehydrogenase
MGQMILITGATDGIGLALARRYADQGARLILIGRRPLDELSDPLFTSDTYCQADLAAGDCADRMKAWLADRQIDRLDLLINNAGTGYVGPVAEQSPESIRTVEAVNLRAPLAITHALLPLVERAGGKLVYIGSVASVLPGPNYAVYTATKAALDAFVRSFRIELATTRSPATALIIHPGATHTGIHAKTGLTPEEMDWTKFTPAAEVATQIADRIARAKRTGAAGFTNNLAYQSLRRWPEPVEWTMRRGGAEPVPEPEARHCIITGGADGIGRALVLTFGTAGYRITALDRDQALAMRTQADLLNGGGSGRFLITDLSDPEQLIRGAQSLAERPPANVVIHNAGISAVGLFATLPLEEQLRVLDINFTAPLLLTRELLAADRLTANAMLVFVSSLSHFAGYPGAAVYAASKAGIAAYARSLAVALAPAGGRVLTVYPGPTRTDHARRYSPDNSREHRRMAPDVLAWKILAAVERGERQLIPGAGNRSFAFMSRLFPSLADTIMRKTLLEKLLAAAPADEAET